MLNPYTPSVRTLYYGREPLLTELLKAEQAANSVVLVAGRRCGKTRTLQRVQELLVARAKRWDMGAVWQAAVSDAAGPPPRMEIPPRWPTLLTLQGGGYDHLSDVLARWAADIRRADWAEGLPAPVACTQLPFEDWLVQADAAAARAGFGGLALLIDETDAILRKEWSHDLLAFFRKIADEVLRTRAWFVLGGSIGLARYKNPVDGSPPLNHARPVLVPGLPAGARCRMMVDPFVKDGRLPPDSAAQRRIDRLAGGNVWLLTLLLERLWEADRIDMAAIDTAAEALIDGQGPVFESWQAGLGEDGVVLYRECAAQGTVPATQLRGARRDARKPLEYHALAERRADGALAMGATLFRSWALERGLVGETVREPGQSADAPGQHRYDVALSFAGPQRPIAERVAGELSRAGKRVFYDQHRAHELWGQDLARCLPEVYDREAELTVLLVSADYVERAWPMVEARTALAKAMAQGWSAVLLVSVDKTTLPDVPDGLVWLDAADPARIAWEITLRLGGR